MCSDARTCVFAVLVSTPTYSVCFLSGATVPEPHWRLDSAVPQCLDQMPKAFGKTSLSTFFLQR